MILNGERMEMERTEMKNKIEVEFEGQSPKQWETIVLDLNQVIDEFKVGWNREGVKTEMKTKNLEGILKRGRSTRKTHVDIK